MATTTPNYGWAVPTSTDLVKDGATAIETLGDAIDASMNTALGTKKAGMVLLNTTSFSGVASVSLPANTFTSTYDNYRLVITLTSTVTTDLRWRGRTSGSDNTVSSYVFQILEAYSTSVGAARTTGANYGYAGYSESGNTNSYILDVVNPFATQPTGIYSTNTRNHQYQKLDIWPSYTPTKSH